MKTRQTLGMELHPALGNLAGLVGTWRGRGHGDYPSIEAFSYLEEVTFGHVGKPFLAYTQKTRGAETNAPLHAESGFIRPGADGHAEWVIAQPTGIVEVLVAERELDFYSASITLSPTAKSVTRVRRALVLDGDTLSYEVHMAAVDEPMQWHLSARLHRDT
jgi:hypothetical protein